MKVNSDCVSPICSYGEMVQNDIEYYAKKLLELVGSCSLIVSIDDSDRPVVLSCNARIVKAIDYCLDRFMEDSNNVF